MTEGDIAIDRLPDSGLSLEVLVLEGARFGSASGSGPRRPHRHDYHELVWTGLGTGQHLIDGEVSRVAPNTCERPSRRDRAVRAAAEVARREIAAQRLGTVDELAAAAAFLCSAGASYITGTTLLVDGGLARAV